MANLDFKIERVTRLCEVNGELGFFHAWEQWSNVVEPNPNALKEFSDVSFDVTDIPKYITSITPKLSASAEFTMEAEINGDMLAELCGFDMAREKGFTVEYSDPVLVRVRRHKKKRINKKWRKRYGYKMIFRKKQLTDCVVSHNISNDELSITARKLFGF